MKLTKYLRLTNILYYQTNYDTILLKLCLCMNCLVEQDLIVPMGHPLCVRHSAVLTKPKIQGSRGQARLPRPPCRKLNLTPLSTDRPTPKTKHTYKTTPLMTERGSEVIPKSEWSCDF